jgi:endothelin-converting enzyme
MNELQNKKFKPVDSSEGEVGVGESRQLRNNFYLKIALGACSLIAIFFFVAFSVSAASNANAGGNGLRESMATTAPCLSSGCVTTSSRVLLAMNQSVSPCDDFYEYACGGWRAANPIPDDKASFELFSWLNDNNQAIERRLLASNLSSVTGGKASHMFLACLDEQTIEERGNQPLSPLFLEIGNTFASLETPWDPELDATALSVMLGKLHLKGGSSFFSSEVGPDDKNSTRNALFINQDGLSLPDRGYYFKDSTTDLVLQAFQAYLAISFQLMGFMPDEAAGVAKRVLDLETQMAYFTIPPDQLRDPVKLYNARTVAKLATDYPSIKWAKYFEQIYGNVPITDTVVSTPAFLRNLTTLLASTPKSVLVEYMQAQVLMAFGNLLSSDFRVNRLQFRRILYGVQAIPERWKLCAGTVDALGFAVGEAFVRTQFSKSARTAAESILSDVTKSFSDSFATLGWMDPATTAAARLKAAKIGQKIGYPQWFDNSSGVENYYSGLGPIGSQFFEDVLTVKQWQEKQDYLSLFKPVDKSKWSMLPQDVNAYYHPSYNEIVFPAGILQPPFFSVAAQKALNYGGIGAVMGHEISHAFDDAGAQYDADGNLKVWWTNSSYDMFREKTSCFANQYSKFVVDGPDGPMKVNGNLTLGENIADNGGVRAAYRAYQSWVARNAPEAKLPGLEADPNKLFFLGYAQVWCQNVRPDYAKLAVLSDSHSPSQYRVNAVAMNSKEFAAAFQCPVGSKMNPLEKCSVW